MSFGPALLAQTTPDVQYEDKKQENDMEALRRWLQDKRMISVKEIGGDLSLSGEARVEFQDTNETRNRLKQRGPGGATNKPAQGWDVEVNIMLDYRTEYTWAAIKLEFDNDMGVRGGKVDRLRLEKAYLGGRWVSGDTLTFDAEIGRRNLFNTFDSKMEFLSIYDGINLRLNKAFQSIADYYFNAGAFLIDADANHYGFVAETGMLRIAQTGLYAKYSVIDWQKHFSDPQKDNRYRFVVQQMLLAYQFNPAWIGKKLIKFYTAGLTNLIADDLVLPTMYPNNTPPSPPVTIVPSDLPTKNFGKQNWGWYIGVAVGQVRKKGDWAVETNFQVAQAQVIPDYDFLGIGRGNAASEGLYTTNLNGSGSYTTIQNAVGPCNYYGFEIDALYAFTDNLSVEENFKWSHTLNTNIGPNLKYKQFEVEFIYAF